MRANHSFASFLLISVTSLEKQLSTVFPSGTFNPHQSIQTRTFYQLVKRSGLLFILEDVNSPLFVVGQSDELCTATSSF